MITKAIVNGLGGSHDDSVALAFKEGYERSGRNYTETVECRVESLNSSLVYADSTDIKVVMRSTTGFGSYLSLANNYPNILTVMPSGSNSFIQVYGGDIPVSIVATGAGDNNNETGYKIEFFAPDTITIEPDLSSYSNGFIAGQLTAIYDILNESYTVDWNTVREFARITGSQDGTFSVTDGYGKINIAGAVNGYIASLVVDPDPDPIITYNSRYATVGLLTGDGEYCIGSNINNKKVLLGNGIFKQYIDIISTDKIVTKDGLIM